MERAVQSRILIVEDEQGIRDMIRFALEQQDFHVIATESVSAANKQLQEDQIDLALVDWMLPGASGIQLIKQLRKNESTRMMPIIMITARSEDSDISEGLDAGADDYITKPFSPKELISRINALLRRSHQFQASSTRRQGDLLVDNSRLLVTINNNTVDMGQIEFRLLDFFLTSPEQVFSRSQLLSGVWGTDSDIDERTVDVHILRLRKALKPHNHDAIIETVRGVGYRVSTKPLDPA